MNHIDFDIDTVGCSVITLFFAAEFFSTLCDLYTCLAVSIINVNGI